MLTPKIHKKHNLGKVKTQKMKPKVKPTNTTVKMLACVCISLCTTVVHNTAWNSYDNLPKTNIIAQMLSVGGGY